MFLISTPTFVMVTTIFVILATSYVICIKDEKLLNPWEMFWPTTEEKNLWSVLSPQLCRLWTLLSLFLFYFIFWAVNSQQIIQLTHHFMKDSGFIDLVFQLLIFEMFDFEFMSNYYIYVRILVDPCVVFHSELSEALWVCRISCSGIDSISQKGASAASETQTWCCWTLVRL